MSPEEQAVIEAAIAWHEARPRDSIDLERAFFTMDRLHEAVERLQEVDLT